MRNKWESEDFWQWKVEKMRSRFKLLMESQAEKTHTMEGLDKLFKIYSEGYIFGYSEAKENMVPRLKSLEAVITQFLENLKEYRENIDDEISKTPNDV